jgi:2-polyprenyl-3-methyl-5-hydroxy-6-metoxy-1,4-benzoquinol methylase
VTHPDRSNGWEGVAGDFIAQARRATIGVEVVRDWAGRFGPGSRLLDLGCGPGGPRSEPLHARSIVHAIDASPTLLRAYQEYFPATLTRCEPAESSDLFGQRFDGVLAWGLLFLLPVARQEEVLRRMAAALAPSGSFLFTAPAEACTWSDLSTGRASRSLGAGRYRALVRAAGLTLRGEWDDEGGNHYYDAVKDATAEAGHEPGQEMTHE